MIEKGYIKYKKDISAFCYYCNTLTWQELWTDGREKIVVCKTCNMEAAQITLFPNNSKQILKKFKTKHQHDINK